MDAKNKLLKCVVTARPFRTPITTPFVAIGLLPILSPPGHARPLLNILTQTDPSSPCNPVPGDVSTNYDYGCCGSRGRRECGADTQECNVGSLSMITDPVSPNVPAPGRDFTLYVTSGFDRWSDSWRPLRQALRSSCALPQAKEILQ